MTPLFIELIEQYLAGKTAHSLSNALFFIFHMLGSWREKSAYRPFANLLRRPADEIDSIFGGATTETTHRVIAAVFDGDPEPLYDVILDAGGRRIRPVADVRSCRDARAARRNSSRRSRAVPACGLFRFQAARECFVWQGWQSAIAALGLVELKPLVEQAFTRAAISVHLGCALKASRKVCSGRSSIPLRLGSTKISTPCSATPSKNYRHGHAFNPKSESDSDALSAQVATSNGRRTSPAVNPIKGIGRNDPCPCGSGKKFKKCCLNSASVS